MDNVNNTSTSSRFNVVIRVRPDLGDESNELTTEEDLFVCVNKLVIIHPYFRIE